MTRGVNPQAQVNAPWASAKTVDYKEMSSIDKTEANRRNSKGESGIRLAVGPHSQGSGSLRMFLEFPGGSAVRTLRFHCQGGGFSHWLGN